MRARDPSGYAPALALGAIVLFAAFAPLASGLDVSTKAIRVDNSSVYGSETVEAYQSNFIEWTGDFQANGVGIAIVDTGVDDAHPALKGSFAAGAQYHPAGEHSDPDCSPGVPCMADETATGEKLNPDDSNGHGTHVASIAMGDDGGPGHRGVASRANLIDVKIATDVGGISAGGIATAIEWIIDYNNGDTVYGEPSRKVHVISLSFGGLEPHQKQEYDTAMSAVRNATQHGITVVASAGNCGPGEGDLGDNECSRNKNGITSPGTAPEAITVGAVDDNQTIRRGEDSVAPYSSRGPNPGDDASDTEWRKPDVVAPGTDIEAACNEQPAQEEWRSDCELSGTSMAAPHVTGLAAIIYQVLAEDKPEFNSFTPTSDSKTPEKIKHIITSTATDWGEDGWDRATGHGYVDGYDAIVKASNTPPIPEFEIVPANVTADQQITFDARNSTDPDDGDEIQRYIWHVDGEKIVSPEPELKHVFDEPGEHVITLVAEDSRGIRSDEAFERTVDVAPKPVEDDNAKPKAELAFSPENPRAGDKITFDASNSTDPENNLTVYAWDFDVTGGFEPDETTNRPTNVFSYEDPGSYEVGLRVKDRADKSDTAFVTVEVTDRPLPPPAVNFTNPQESDIVDVGAILATWSLTEGSADGYHVYLDGIKEDVTQENQLRINVSEGNHTLRVTARGSGGNSTDFVNFTAVDNEALTSQSGDCPEGGCEQASADEDTQSSHAHGSDTHTHDDPPPSPPDQDRVEKSTNDTANQAPAPAAGLVGAVLAGLALLARRSRA